MPEHAVDAVGRKLKAIYDEMLREPIPDKLMQLLDELDNAVSKDSNDQPLLPDGPGDKGVQHTTAKKGE